MLVSVALALLLLPRGAEAAELLADVLVGCSVSLCDECKAALVSTRAIDAAVRDDRVKWRWWSVPPTCMLGVALPEATTAQPWREKKRRHDEQRRAEDGAIWGPLQLRCPTWRRCDRAVGGQGGVCYRILK
jgi:hypothetical protein